jgi:hypothetical protein
VRRLSLFTLALTSLLAACASEHPAPPEPASAPLRTGRFEVTIAANGADGQVSLHATGAFDDDRRRYALSVDLGGLPADLGRGVDGTVEVVQVDEVTYLRSPSLARALGAGTAWVRVDGGAGRALVDVRDLLDRLVATGTMRFDASGESANASIRFIDTGAPVVIEPPPAAEVTDVTAAVEALARRGTGG